MRVMCSIAFVAVACTAPSAESTRSRDQPSSAEPEPRDEAREWIAAYKRGEVAMASGDPQVNYVTSDRDGRCLAMPPERPADFQVTYWEDPYDDGVQIYYGIAGRDRGACTFEWDMFWIAAPAGSCVVLDDADLDELYAELRELGVWTFESEPMEPTPHTVGKVLMLRWPGSRCEFVNVHGVAQIASRHEQGFRAALDAFQRAFARARRGSGG